MKLFETRQILVEELQQKTIDILIATASWECRAVFAPKLLEDRECVHRIAIQPASKRFLDVNNNDLQLHMMGYEFRQAAEGDREFPRNLMDELMQSMQGSTLAVAIDYSCMPMAWYSAFVDYFAESSLDFDQVDVDFIYTPGKFTDLPESQLGDSIGPLSNHWHLQFPDRATALVMDLSCEKGRAQGLAEYISPMELFAFHANGFPDSDFLDVIMENNKGLVEQLRDGGLIAYSLNDLQKVESKLAALCMELREKYRVIIMPLGPKPFGLLSLLLSIRLPVVDVWQVESVEQERPIDRIPVGTAVVYRASFKRAV